MKWSYQSEYDAWKMIGYMTRKGLTPLPNRVYPCPYGHGFHKSSRPERVQGYNLKA